MAPTAQILTSKDAAQLRSAMAFYEHRQYKKGLKVCEGLLKKCPDNAECLAVKALLLGHSITEQGEGKAEGDGVDKKKEAFDAVRLALGKNLRSAMAWHVYGLLHKLDRNYEEALKCFRGALKQLDPSNTNAQSFLCPTAGQIHRDVATLQTQLRQWEPLVETRFALLQERPTMRTHWLALALAYYLGGQFCESVSVLDAFFAGAPAPPPGTNRVSLLELAEIHFFRIRALLKSGASAQMVRSSIEQNGRWLKLIPIDHIQLLAEQAEREGKADEAQVHWKKLFALHGGENKRILQNLCSQGQTHLKNLLEEHPHSLLLKLQLLSSAPVESFHNLLVSFIAPMVSSGVPSAHRLIRPLYTDASPEKMQVLEGFVQELEQEQSPWTLVFSAQHHLARKRCNRAIALFDRALSLSKDPTLLLLYAKALKKADMLDEAADCLLRASQLDPTDRFLNSRAIKYLLRAGRIPQAKEIACLFLRRPTGSSLSPEQLQEAQLRDLTDMQSISFAAELGRALCTAAQVEEGLAQLQQVYTYFKDFANDQYDFHAYVFRRCTFRSYLDLLDWTDNRLWAHPYFVRAASIAIPVLLDVGKPLEALVWLDKLEQYSPTDPDTCRLAVACHLAQQQESSRHLLHVVRSLWQLIHATPNPIAREDIVLARRYLPKLAQSLVSFSKDGKEEELALIKSLLPEIEQILASAELQSFSINDDINGPAPLVPSLKSFLETFEK